MAASTTSYQKVVDYFIDVWSGQYYEAAEIKTMQDPKVKETFPIVTPPLRLHATKLRVKDL